MNLVLPKLRSVRAFSFCGRIVVLEEGQSFKGYSVVDEEGREV